MTKIGFKGWRGKLHHSSANAKTDYTALTKRMTFSQRWKLKGTYLHEYMQPEFWLLLRCWLKGWLTWSANTVSPGKDECRAGVIDAAEERNYIMVINAAIVDAAKERTWATVSSRIICKMVCRVRRISSALSPRFQYVVLVQSQPLEQEMPVSLTYCWPTLSWSRTITLSILSPSSRRSLHCTLKSCQLLFLSLVCYFLSVRISILHSTSIALEGVH